MSEKTYIECGKIINTHGCKGGLKLESWCNSPEDLASLKKIYLSISGEFEEFKILKASVFKQFVLLDLKGITDMDMALALKNHTVYANRKDFQLEKGEYFIADIIGIPVIDADTNKIYGKVKDLINRGASDIYVIQTANGEAMIPAVEEFIVEVDIKKGLFVRPIPGMFDLEG